MDTELHLPWENAALEALLLKIVKTGETTKVDFKRQLNISSAEHHAELIKDISALANTYDYPYRNHGFIVLGVSGNQLSFTKFDQNADALQASIDQLIKNYVEPFIPTQTRIFGNGEQTWGVIVVPPTRTAPHVFVKDIHKRCRGEIFVRRGTTTDKAGPSDYVRFFRLHLDEHTYELREQIEDLKREVAVLKRRPAAKAKVQVDDKRPSVQAEPNTESHLTPAKTSEPETVSDLLRAIDSTLAQAEDPIASGLIREAQKIQKFLASDIIAWGLNNISKEIGKKCLDDVEHAAGLFWASLASLVYKDEKGKYDNAIVRAFSHLAQTQNAPSGISYTDWGLNFRYLPLVVSLYVLFVIGFSKKKHSLLKKVLALPLASRSPYEEPSALPKVLLYIRGAEPVFQTQHLGHPNSRWCDAIGSVIEPILQRLITIDDPLWERREAFFVGEFALCLSPLDVVDRETKLPSIGLPSRGLYLYISEANPLVKRFLRTDSQSLAEIFTRPVRDILSDFDKTAMKLISPGCWGNGFAGGAVKEAFPNSETSNK